MTGSAARLALFFLLWIRHAPGAHPHDSQKTLSYIIQQFRCWGLLHFDVSEEFLTCIFKAGPEEIYHIVDDQEPVMIPLADIDGDGWVLLIMSLDVKLLLV